MSNSSFHFTKRQKVYLFFKRAIDIFGSTVGIIILSPVLLLCAIITKCTSRGPIIYKSKRLGRNEKPFTFLKFRSMKVNAPQKGQESMTKEEHDSYVTKWGRFMRKTSLDELPQLFNIFVGQMSFIGPRPQIIVDERERDELYILRRSYVPDAFFVRPGLSGYSQIKYHRDSDPSKKAYGDSYYVGHLSFWLDFRLFFVSFLVLFGYQPGK